jgi:hypothetical protein
LEFAKCIKRGILRRLESFKNIEKGHKMEGSISKILSELINYFKEIEIWLSKKMQFSKIVNYIIPIASGGKEVGSEGKRSSLNPPTGQ